MASAYLEDLQVKVVIAYEQGLGTILEIAKQYQVGKTTVSKLV